MGEGLTIISHLPRQLGIEFAPGQATYILGLCSPWHYLPVSESVSGNDFSTQAISNSGLHTQETYLRGQSFSLKTHSKEMRTNWPGHPSVLTVKPELA